MLSSAHLDAYLRHLADDLRRAPSTVAGYRSELRLLLDRGVAPEPDALAAFVTRTAGGGLLAPTTRNRRLAIVRGFARYLVRSGHLAADPTGEIRRARVPLRTAAALGSGDVAAAIAAATLEPDRARRVRDRAIVVVLFYTGLRVTELLRLDLTQLDFPAGLLRHATRKGGGTTDVVLHPCAAEALAAWLAVRGDGDSPAVFPRGNTGRLSVRAVQKRLRGLGATAGLGDRMHPHALRHAHATALLRSGTPTELIRQSLNHRSLQTTQRYLHGDLGMVRDAVESLPWVGGADAAAELPGRKAAKGRRRKSDL